MLRKQIFGCLNYRVLIYMLKVYSELTVVFVYMCQIGSIERFSATLFLFFVLFICLLVNLFFFFIHVLPLNVNMYGLYYDQCETKETIHKITIHLKTKEMVPKITIRW